MSQFAAKTSGIMVAVLRAAAYLHDRESPVAMDHLAAR
jgi:hypothetical protein